jgi:hypothetical protein
MFHRFPNKKRPERSGRYTQKQITVDSLRAEFLRAKQDRMDLFDVHRPDFLFRESEFNQTFLLLDLTISFRTPAFDWAAKRFFAHSSANSHDGSPKTFYSLKQVEN